MTHDEAVALLPAYALGALDDRVAELESHLESCQRCADRLATYLETTTALGEAIEPIAPPASLRASVLASLGSAGLASPEANVAASRPTLVASNPKRPPPTDLRRIGDEAVSRSHSGFWRLTSGRFSQIARPVAAALIVLAVGFGAGTAVENQRSRSATSELALDRQGLALLTSTETRNERLVPFGDPTSPWHGHWYHRDGVPTQVVVVELLPPAKDGETYYGWLGRSDGVWQPLGPLTLDEHGYGRVILPGSDGHDIHQVVVTRQSGPTATPGGEEIIGWAAP